MRNANLRLALRIETTEQSGDKIDRDACQKRYFD